MKSAFTQLINAIIGERPQGVFTNAWAPTCVSVNTEEWDVYVIAEPGYVVLRTSWYAHQWPTGQAGEWLKAFIENLSDTFAVVYTEDIPQIPYFGTIADAAQRLSEAERRAEEAEQRARSAEGRLRALQNRK